MIITYPEVQISGTAEEICAVLQCLMLNVAAGSLREEMDRVAEAMGAADERPKNTYYARFRQTDHHCGDIPESVLNFPRPSVEEFLDEDPEENPSQSQENCLQEPEKKKHSGIKEATQVEVQINGKWVLFDSIRDAGKRIGTEGSYLAKALREGKKTMKGFEVRYAEKSDNNEPLEIKSEPPTKKQHVPTGKSTPRAVEVRKDEGEWVRYSSVKSAGKAIGVPSGTVSRALKNGYIVRGCEVRYEGQERVKKVFDRSICGKPRKVDVMVAGEWYTHDSVLAAAKFLGCGSNNLIDAIKRGHYKEFKVRYHDENSDHPSDNPELDAILKEIEDRNKQPYEISSRL